MKIAGAVLRNRAAVYLTADEVAPGSDGILRGMADLDIDSNDELYILLREGTVLRSRAPHSVTSWRDLGAIQDPRRIGVTSVDAVDLTCVPLIDRRAATR